MTLVQENTSSAKYRKVIFLIAVNRKKEYELDVFRVELKNMTGYGLLTYSVVTSRSCLLVLTTIAPTHTRA